MRFSKETWSGRRDSNPQPSAWESSPVVLVYQYFSIFPKVFDIVLDRHFLDTSDEP